MNAGVRSEPERRLVTINEACAIVRVTRRTIYNWIRQRKVEIERTAGGRVRIDAATLFTERRHAGG